MTSEEVIAAYLDAIKVQKVDMKLGNSPAKLRGKKRAVPMEFLAGVDEQAWERLRTKFKILARGFDIDEELTASGLDGSYCAYCQREESVKHDFIYAVDRVGSVILSADAERFQAAVKALEREAQALQAKLMVMLKDKVSEFARELYRALVPIWGAVEPEWWLNYRKDNPLDSREREIVFCDLMFRSLESALDLKTPDYWLLLTRFNPEIAADGRIRKAFKSAFRQYLRTGTGRDLDWLIGPDPNDRQGLLF